MNNKMVEFNKNQKTAEMPDLQTGDVVRIFRKIIEGGKERVQMFQGIILAIKGKQSSSPTITVRKVSNGVGVELVLPIHSPMIERIEMVKRAKVRRSKLYYIRDKSAKSLKLKFTDSDNTGKQKEVIASDIIEEKEVIESVDNEQVGEIKSEDIQETK